MYAEHFNLRTEPFGLTPDPAYLYLSPDHREALAAVSYGITEGRGFVTLVGEVGTGKTTVLYTLLSQMGPEVRAAYVSYTTQSFEELFATALRDLGVEVAGTSKLALLTAFNAHLLSLADEEHSTALIFDEAQNLSDATFEELRLLSNFETYSRKLLQIVLVGQPELQERLRRPQLRQLKERVSVRAFINPLSRTETERYIAHRLERVGGSAERLFERRALRAIVRRSGGIPRRVNILCHNALLFAYGRNLPRVTAEAAREAIAEMDERRPGWLPRPALRRVLERSFLWRWTAGLAIATAVLVGLRVMSSFFSVESAAVASLPGFTEPAAVEPEAVSIPAPPAELGPARIAGTAALERAGENSARTNDRIVQSADIAEGRPIAVSSPEPLALTVPPGATLIRLLHDLYGRDMDSVSARELFAEILRLNPQVQDVNLIFAGDSLRLPRPPARPGDQAPGGAS